MTVSEALSTLLETLLSYCHAAWALTPWGAAAEAEARAEERRDLFVAQDAVRKLAFAAKNERAARNPKLKPVAMAQAIIDLCEKHGWAYAKLADPDMGIVTVTPDMWVGKIQSYRHAVAITRPAASNGDRVSEAELSGVKLLVPTEFVDPDSAHAKHDPTRAARRQQRSRRTSV